jgi:hypothetical protein
MDDFQYLLTLARGFAPAAPVAKPCCDVIELRQRTLHPGQRDAPAAATTARAMIAATGEHADQAVVR